MRTAYSIDAGRVLEARELDYSDCRDDRVICEYCRNRVFKGIRRTGGKPVHYLSHYRAQSEQARTCEARAASREREVETDSEAETRGQSLRLRVAALRRVLHAQFPNRVARSEVFRISARSPTMKRGKLLPPTLLTVMRHVMVQGFEVISANAGFQLERFVNQSGYRPDLLKSLYAGIRTDPPIAIASPDARQKRIADDMRTLLLTNESKKALDALHDNAWASLLIDPWARPKDPFEEECIRRMQLTDAVRGGDTSHIDEFCDERSHQYSDWISAAIAHRMEQILLEIDYMRPVPPAPALPPKRKPRPKKTRRRR